MSAPATYLLDTSFLIDLADETEFGEEGPARRAAETLGTHAYVSAVSVAEFLEGAEDREAARRFLSAFRFQPLGWGSAQRCALNQARNPRRMGENDAWQVALAMTSGHKLLGHDHIFERRNGLDYIDHWKF
jgi:predicted nucleic acid-binding protein